MFTPYLYLMRAPLLPQCTKRGGRRTPRRTPLRLHLQRLGSHHSLPRLLMQIDQIAQRHDDGIQASHLSFQIGQGIRVILLISL
jgi:hypothetical protein